MLPALAAYGSFRAEWFLWPQQQAALVGLGAGHARWVSILPAFVVTGFCCRMTADEDEGEGVSVLGWMWLFCLMWFDR
jgi:hypothetical protein